MKKLVRLMLTTCMLCSITSAYAEHQHSAAELHGHDHSHDSHSVNGHSHNGNGHSHNSHNHSHNHFNPALEQRGDEIIGLTVCYKNGYLADNEQEVVFSNLIELVGVTGEELGMYYMDSLGAEAEIIMSNDEARSLWDKQYCGELITSYLDKQQLEAKRNEQIGSMYETDHTVSPELLQQDIEQGRLLSIQ
ncbi:hypothetical protein L1D44_17105 [Shewanella sp. Isolate13]|uniref:hypothetical protein n=1 Tax=Shewanella sp. Isolate13 TaxID=2908531 RepID=UPI001EFD0592|nr:hypothetical protein [Shewanella sp. Isolate13]MCG9731514.1 hypothetical protein [Shewanella sp. Isolate13]